MERKSIKLQYKWNVEGLFDNEQQWQELYDKTYGEIDFSSYIGNLSNAKVLLDCLKYQEYLSKNTEKLYLYAHMKKDEDTRDSKFFAMHSKAQALYVKLSTASAFIVPELTALDESVLKGFEKSEQFSDYDYMLYEIIKNKKHILSADEESLLASAGDIYQSFKDIFSMIDNADLPLPEIDDGKGGKIKLTHGNYSVVLHGADRQLRERAFKAYYSAYIGLINTISATYYGSVKKDVYITRARKYSSCLERALNNEDVQKVVYENLLESTTAALPILHKYIAARKKILKLDKMYSYDLYVPIVEGAELKLEYDEAYKLVTDGLKPLGSEYTELMNKAYSERWIDVEETVGKRSGAYSTSIYEHHPFVLLNYKKTTHDVFTIAHEMGHAIHSYYSSKSQPYAKADYRIFVAEVASTVNEVLLLKYILNTTEDKALKKYLLSYFIDMIRTTLFRQTMFAEFEYIAHSAVENNRPLDKEYMCEKYLELNKKYYGSALISEGEIQYEWARIPHFYTPFYVYKYATGIISAISIAEDIFSKKEGALMGYKAFLSSGGSKGPVELLKLAGVDLTKKQAFENANRVFEKTLNEFLQTEY